MKQGHTAAGAALLALACEYRVMLPNLAIGSNCSRLVSSHVSQCHNKTWG